MPVCQRMLSRLLGGFRAHQIGSCTSQMIDSVLVGLRILFLAVWSLVRPDAAVWLIVRFTFSALIIILHQDLNTLSSPGSFLFLLLS